MKQDNWEDDFDPIDPALDGAVYDAVKEGCELRVKGVSDMVTNKTRWYVGKEGSFFMHIAAIAELIKYLAMEKEKSFKKLGHTDKDGKPYTWEDIAETLIVSSAYFLGIEVKVTGKVDQEAEEEEDMSKYREL